MARVLLGAAATLILGLLPAIAAEPTPLPCGPFGDPPARIESEAKPFCLSGQRLGPWIDPDGTNRYACLYEPQSPPGVRLPLLVFLHPSLLSADSVKLTGLVAAAAKANLSGDAARRGFILIAPQGRNTSHYYPFPDSSGWGWDNWYRQLSPAGAVTLGNISYNENADAVAIDHFIGQMVAGGKVDRRRIYLTGWSNGAAMAILYALNRADVAAAAVYSAPDPFGSLLDACPQEPVAGPAQNSRQIQVFNPHVPLMHIHNDCDIAGICPNGERMAQELSRIGTPVYDVVINSMLRQVPQCMSSCGIDPNGQPGFLNNPLAGSLGTANHGRWPYGWTDAMLQFLREHPLKAAAEPAGK